MPFGANGMHSSAVSSINWSTCEPEKMPQAVTKESKLNQQMLRVTLGQRFNTKALALTSPSAPIVVIMLALVHSQNNPGARIKA